MTSSYDKRAIYISNLGYLYCASHGVDQTGGVALEADSCHAHEPCDWPGCDFGTGSNQFQREAV